MFEATPGTCLPVIYIKNRVVDNGPLQGAGKTVQIQLVAPRWTNVLGVAAPVGNVLHKERLAEHVTDDHRSLWPSRSRIRSRDSLS